MILSKQRLSYFAATCYLASALLLIAMSSCSDHSRGREEQIRLNRGAGAREGDTTSANTISGTLSFNQIATYPQRVIMTGIPQYRLVSVYKQQQAKSGKDYSWRSAGYEYDYEETARHFMPGIDLLFGYNLINVGHYDLQAEKLEFLFDRPVLIKSLYYPSFVQDSLRNKPISRNYYLVSVYDEDTNADSVINRHDLRRFYFFDASGKEKKQLIPADYSVVRSQYDSDNDVMYIFARQDANNNGRIDVGETMRVFWISLASPSTAKNLY